MRVTLIRHGETPGNALLRYIGSTDEPLSPRGEAQAAAIKPPICPDTVYVSALRRSTRTAALLFPGAKMLADAGLNEMDFGRFEGRSFTDMEGDIAYRDWVEGGCTGICPGGESREAFCERVCAAFEKIFRAELEKGTEQLCFVIHGGSIMAIMARWARPGRDYFDWSVKNCGGYTCRAGLDSDGVIVLTDWADWRQQ